MYHRLGPVRPESIVPGQYVTPDRFCSHLRVLSRLGYQCVGPEQALDKRRSAVITFDDGYTSFAEVAAPELLKRNWTATVFLVSDCVGGTNGWDEAIGDVSESLMSWDTIRSLSAKGMQFGSHTASHCHLDRVDSQAVTTELASSKNKIEAELKEPCRWFCYPYGGMNGSVAEAVRASGYEAAFATTKGAWTAASDRFAVPRINVRADTSAAVLAYKIFRAVAFGR